MVTESAWEPVAAQAQRAVKARRMSSRRFVIGFSSTGWALHTALSLQTEGRSGYRTARRLFLKEVATVKAGRESYS
jgi:hypothetical protein